MLRCTPLVRVRLKFTKKTVDEAEIRLPQPNNFENVDGIDLQKHYTYIPREIEPPVMSLGVTSSYSETTEKEFRATNVENCSTSICGATENNATPSATPGLHHDVHSPAQIDSEYYDFLNHEYHTSMEKGDWEGALEIILETLGHSGFGEVKPEIPAEVWLLRQAELLVVTETYYEALKILNHNENFHKQYLFRYFLLSEALLALGRAEEASVYSSKAFSLVETSSCPNVAQLTKEDVIQLLVRISIALGKSISVRFLMSKLPPGFESRIAQMRQMTTSSTPTTDTIISEQMLSTINSKGATSTVTTLRFANLDLNPYLLLPIFRMVLLVENDCDVKLAVQSMAAVWSKFSNARVDVYYLSDPSQAKLSMTGNELTEILTGWELSFPVTATAPIMLSERLRHTVESYLPQNSQIAAAATGLLNISVLLSPRYDSFHDLENTVQNIATRLDEQNAHKSQLHIQFFQVGGETDDCDKLEALVETMKQNAIGDVRGQRSFRDIVSFAKLNRNTRQDDENAYGVGILDGIMRGIASNIRDNSNHFSSSKRLCYS